MALYPLAFVAALAAQAPPSSSEAAAEKALRSATGLALQGRMAPALAMLEQAPPALLDAKDRAVRQCMIDRFGTAPGAAAPTPPGPVADRALALYRAYWRASLLQPDTRAAREDELSAKLRALLGLPADAAWERIEATLKSRARSEGVHVLMGRTPPLLEFMMWRSERSEQRRVPLPEGRHSIRVSILDDFASLGWSAFATCDRSFTGGWVAADAIHAVRPGWKDLAAENFQVSFLAHETQHFADKKRFGELESWELEYRAKLAELALARSTLPRILSAFLANQGADRGVPHSYANRLVLSWLARELTVAGPQEVADQRPEAIRRAAHSLLRRDSAQRLRRLKQAPRPAAARRSVGKVAGGA